MDFTFTPETAATLLKYLSPVAVLVAGYVFTNTRWDKRLKIGLVFALSALLGGFTAFAEGNFSLTGNFWDNFTQVFASSQLAYWGLMKGLNLETRFMPIEAAASQAADQAREQISEMPIDQVKDAVDPATSAKIETTVQVTQ